MCKEQKATNEEYRKGWDRVFKEAKDDKDNRRDRVGA